MIFASSEAPPLGAATAGWLIGLPQLIGLPRLRLLVSRLFLKKVFYAPNFGDEQISPL